VVLKDDLRILSVMINDYPATTSFAFEALATKADLRSVKVCFDVLRTPEVRLRISQAIAGRDPVTGAVFLYAYEGRNQRLCPYG
jgi:hypothetical protein